MPENKTESPVIDGFVLFGADNFSYWFPRFFQRKQLLGLADYFALSSFTYLDDETAREERVISMFGMQVLVQRKRVGREMPGLVRGA